MKKLSDRLYKMTTNKRLIISIIIFVVFIATVAPLAANYMDEVTNGASSPDMSFDYEADDLFQMAQDYGAEGRRAYIILRFTFDLAFPIVYLFFLVMTLTKLLSYVPKDSRLRCLNVLPFFGVFFDFIENIMAAIVIGSYPQKVTVAAHIAPYASMLKWLFIGISFVLIIVLLIYRAVIAVSKYKKV